VAAVLYGVGARLDRKPDLLFLLRQVDQNELIAHATTAAPVSKKAAPAAKVLAEGDLAGIFGLDMAESAVPRPASRKQSKPAAKKARKKTAPKKRAAKKASKRSRTG
jgi:uncharacterized Zn finger protein